MCDIEIEGTRYEDDRCCSFKAVATATSKTLHGINEDWSTLRLCKRHATVYENKYKKYWSVERDA